MKKSEPFPAWFKSAKTIPPSILFLCEGRGGLPHSLDLGATRAERKALLFTDAEAQGIRLSPF
jgi:hypothetical protein